MTGTELDDAVEEVYLDLVEAKHVGTFTRDDPHRERTTKAIHQHDRPRDLRRRQGDIAKRQLAKDLNELRARLYNLVGNYFDQEGNATEHPDAPASKTALRKAMLQALREHYQNAFMLGLHGAGLKHAMDFTQARLTQEERAWVESALQHEARFFRKFFDDMLHERSKTNIWKRVDAYVETVNAIYHAGVVRATPAESIFHWLIHPAEHCEGCLWLARHSPYTKFTLPTTPKAGSTACLNNCRCSILIRKARPGEVEKVAARNLANSTALKKLADLKNRRVPHHHAK